MKQLFFVLVLTIISAIGYSQSPGKVLLADFEPATEPLASPLDAWGDWFDYSDNWKATRKLVEEGKEGRALCVTFEAKDDEISEGWGFFGMETEPLTWLIAKGATFWLKGSRDGNLVVHFSASSSRWDPQPLARVALPLTTEWTHIELAFSTIRTIQGQPLDPRRVGAIYFGIEGSPGQVWMDSVCLLTNAEDARRLKLAQFADRGRALMANTEVFEARAFCPKSYAEAASNAYFAIQKQIGQVAEAGVALPEAVEQPLLAAEAWASAVKHYLALRGALAWWKTNLTPVEGEDRKAPEEAIMRLEEGLLEAESLLREGSSEELVSLLSGSDEKLGEVWAAFFNLPAEYRAKRRMRFEGARMLDPAGKQVNLFGPYLFRTIYVPGRSEGGYRPLVEADFRQIAWLGFNAVRLVVQLSDFMPERGLVDEEYASYMRTCIAWADKWGLVVDVDPHWPYPEWFHIGPEGFENAHNDQQNPYQDPEGLALMIRTLASLVAPCENVVSFEVPTNEPAISSIEPWWTPEEDAGTIADLPWLMKSWNDFLKARYGSDAALNRAWSATRLLPARNGLAEGESLAKGTVLPPGSHGEPGKTSARLADYLTWAREYQVDLCAQLARLIKEEAPFVQVVQQYSAGGHEWEKDPIPLDLVSFMQWHTPGLTSVGTHYGAGGTQARLAAATGTWSFDSEVVPRLAAQFVSQIGLGQGFLPFTYFNYRDVGFLNERSEIRPEAAFVAKAAPFFAAAFRERAPQVLCVGSLRRMALGSSSLDSMMRLVEQCELDWDAASSDYLAAHPELLSKYQAVIAELDGMEPEAVLALAESGKPVLLAGWPWQGASGLTGAKGLQAELAKRSLFWAAPPTPLAEGGQFSQIELAGLWQVFYGAEGAPEPALASAAEYDASAWETTWIPGLLGEGTSKWRDFVGPAFVRTTFTVPSAWQGQELELALRWVEADARLYLNGQALRPAEGEALRGELKVKLPATLVHLGQENCLVVALELDHPVAGITAGPCVLRVANLQGAFARDFGYMKSSVPFQLALSSATPRGKLAENVESLATAGMASTPVLLKQRNCYLWTGEEELDAARAGDLLLVASFLKESGLVPLFPPDEERSGLETLDFGRWLTAINRASKARPVKLPAGQVLRPLLATSEGPQIIDNTPSSRLLLPASTSPLGSAEVWERLPVWITPSQWQVEVNNVQVTAGLRSLEINFEVQGAGELELRLADSVDEIELSLDNEIIKSLRSDTSARLGWEPSKHTVRLVLRAASGDQLQRSLTVVSAPSP